MTVYLPKNGRTYRYDFERRGRRHFGSTGMSRQRDAEEFERKLRVSMERQDGDLSLRASETPRFVDWAEVFYEHKLKRKKLKRPDLLEREINVVLEFCGPRPTTPPAPRRPGAPPRRVVPVAPPYHDLRLGDFIEHPEWITEFERWLAARGTGGSARNHYRSVLSGMYKIAMLPEYRRATGVRLNPFAGIERDRPVRRRVTQTVEQLQAWILHASPHVQLALAIGALAPALRLGNILALRWNEHVDAALRFITVTDYKTDQDRLEPLVIPITGQLQQILRDARKAWEVTKAEEPKTSNALVQFRGKPVLKITKALREAARRAQVPYGTKAAGGATFHTLRHSMSTLLADMGVSESHRKELLNHANISTTQIYTHLRPVHLVSPLEQLSNAVPIAASVTGKVVGKVAGPGLVKADQPRGKPRTSRKRVRKAPVKNAQGKSRRSAPRRRAS